MKTLFLSLYMHTPHFETELDLISDLICEGSDVYVVGCRGQLSSCELNPAHLKHICVFCRSKFENGLRKAGVRPDRIIDFPEPRPDYSVLPDEFLDVEALTAFSVDGVDIGRGAASSLITRINKDPHFDTLAHRDAVRRELEAAYLVLRNMSKLLASIRPAQVYLFNGRFSTYYPAVALCRRLGIPFYTHERAGMLGRYLIRRDCLPHDLAWAKRELAEVWEAGPPDKEAIGAAWFHGRRNGAEQAWVSYIASQKAGTLPDSFDRGRRNIAVFSSTLEEFATIPGYENPLFKDEVVAMRRILERFRGDASIHFYLRMHPNMRGIPRQETYQLREVAAMAPEFPNLEVIWPESPIHTYALMEASDSVLTFGSTMGIEASFWGKASIVVGRAFYEDLGGFYRPSDAEELFHLLRSPLAPMDNHGAHVYGYWETARGTPFKRFRQEGIFGGTFDGEPIGPTRLARLRSLAIQIAGARGLGELRGLLKEKAGKAGLLKGGKR